MTFEIEPYRREANSIIADLREHQIQNPEDNAAVGELLRTIKTRQAFIHEKKEEMLVPQREATEKIRAFFRPVEEEFNAAEQLIKQRMAEFFQASKEAETKALLAAAESGSRALVDLASQATPVVQGISMREAYEAVVVNPDLIPDEYKIVDLAKIKAVVRASKGTVRIPGVEVRKNTIVAAKKA